MKKKFEAELEKANEEMEELEKEWERLDSTGQSELQRQISKKMEILQRQINSLKFTIKQYK